MRFVASNGAEVTVDHRKTIVVTKRREDGKATTLNVDTRGEKAAALFEFLDRRRDHELGRWRWPEHPSYLVYPDQNNDDLVRIFHETTGAFRTVTRGEAPSDNFRQAAAAYFG